MCYIFIHKYFWALSNKYCSRYWELYSFGGEKSPKSCLPGGYILVCVYGDEEETKTTKQVKRMSSVVSEPRLSPAQPFYVKA